MKRHIDIRVINKGYIKGSLYDKEIGRHIITVVDVSPKTMKPANSALLGKEYSHLFPLQMRSLIYSLCCFMPRVTS